MARKRKATGGSGTLGAANHSLSGSNYGSGSGNGKGPKRHHPNGFRGGDDFNDGRGGRGEGGGSLGLAGAFTATRGYTDPVTGQRGAFPGLDDGGDGFFCGPAYSGMDYLRMVRSEARGVPSLLVAKPANPATKPGAVNANAPTDSERRLASTQYQQEDDSRLDYDGYWEAEDGEIIDNDDELGPDYYKFTDVDYDENEDETPIDDVGDTRGFYEDGTYTASATYNFPQRPPSPKRASLLTWHDEFIANFRRLRQEFHQNLLHKPPPPPPPSAPPPESTTTTPPHPGTSISPHHPLPRTQEDWLHLFYTHPPTPHYLTLLDQPTVLKLLKLMKGHIHCGTDIPVEQTHWIFGLLVRCSEVMTSDEVFVVRELGKRAREVLERLEESRAKRVEEGRRKQLSGGEKKSDKEGSDGDGGKVRDGGGKGGDEDQDELPKQDEKASLEGAGNAPHEQKLEVEEGDDDGEEDGNIDAHQNTAVTHPQETPLTKPDHSSQPSQPSPASTIPAPTTTQTTLSRLQKQRKNRKNKSGLYDYSPPANTLGTLDMIVSVVGDFYGQKDLLGKRVVWGEVRD